MSATYFRVAAPVILSLVTACATKTTQPTMTSTTTHATAVPKSNVVYVTGSRLGIPSSSGNAQGAQPIQSVGQQQIQQSGQTNMSDAMKFLVPAQQISTGGMTGGK